jgi:hypothetical protein
LGGFPDTFPGFPDTFPGFPDTFPGFPDTGIPDTFQSKRKRNKISGE